MARRAVEFEKFEMNSEGYKAVLRSSGVQEDLEARARRVAAMATDMYNPSDRILGVRADSYRGKGRAGATVVALGELALQVESERRVLGNAMTMGGR